MAKLKRKKNTKENDKFRIGDFVEIYWKDHAGGINVDIDECSICDAITRGTVYYADEDQVKIWASMFLPSKERKGDPTALGMGLGTYWYVIMKREQLEEVV